MLKAIIFDYDGVLVDSFPNVHKVYKVICKKLGKKCPAKIEDFKRVYGDTSAECYNQLEFSQEDKVKASTIFKEEILTLTPNLFPEIKKVLANLHKNFMLFVVSSSYKQEVEQKLNRFKIRHFFKDVLARIECSTRFEKTESIKKISQNYNLTPEDILLIGDRNIDFIEGSKAGIKNILLVDYGWGYNLTKIPEYKQRFIINSPKEIIQVVKKF